MIKHKCDVIFKSNVNIHINKILGNKKKIETKIDIFFLILNNKNYSSFFKHKKKITRLYSYIYIFVFFYRKNKLYYESTLKKKSSTYNFNHRRRFPVRIVICGRCCCCRVSIRVRIAHRGLLVHAKVHVDHIYRQRGLGGGTFITVLNRRLDDIIGLEHIVVRVVLDLGRRSELIAKDLNIGLEAHTG